MPLISNLRFFIVSLQPTMGTQVRHLRSLRVTNPLTHAKR